MITVILSKILSRNPHQAPAASQLNTDFKCLARVFFYFPLSPPVGVVIIDDHPEVTTTEDPQSSANDDGFTEVVSRKQQKRLQDEEKRKKEEQITQVCGSTALQLN